MLSEATLTVPGVIQRASRAEYEMASRPKNLSRDDRCRVLIHVQTRSHDSSAQAREPDDGLRILNYCILKPPYRARFLRYELEKAGDIGAAFGLRAKPALRFFGRETNRLATSVPRAASE